MSFLRHAGIYRSDVVHKTIKTWGGAPPPAGRPPAPVKGRDGRNYAPCSSSAMSSRAGYSLAGCSPAEPASASPTAPSMGWGITAGNELSANGNLSLVSVSRPRGSLQCLVVIPRIFAPWPCFLPVQQSAAPRSTVEVSLPSRGMGQAETPRLPCW
jgi:hypothetical protein